jgi:hypothetical protein
MAIALTEAANKTPELFEGAIATKTPRHVTIALRHLEKQREKALDQRAKLTKEIDSLDAAILALG